MFDNVFIADFLIVSVVWTVITLPLLVYWIIYELVKGWSDPPDEPICGGDDGESAEEIWQGNEELTDSANAASIAEPCATAISATAAIPIMRNDFGVKNLCAVPHNKSEGTLSLPVLKSNSTLPTGWAGMYGIGETEAQVQAKLVALVGDRELAERLVNFELTKNDAHLSRKLAMTWAMRRFQSRMRQ